jgi:hypothetical protein
MFKPLLVGSWILVGLGLDYRSNFKVFGLGFQVFLESPWNLMWELSLFSELS